MGNQSIPRILFVTAACPPGRPGSNVVMKHLIDSLPVGSYKIITMDRGEVCGPDFESRVLRIDSKMRMFCRLSPLVSILKTCCHFFKAKRFALEFGPQIIVSSYPSWDFMILGVMLAKSLKIPFIQYLHDTILESFEHSHYKWLAAIVQKFLFANATKTMVISEGMARLYREKYNLDVVSIEHIIPEDITFRLPPKTLQQNDAFWAGAIYSINDHALKRVFEAVKSLKRKFTFTDRTSIAALADNEITGECIRIVSLPSRKEYIEFIANRGFAVLALNSDDESPIGVDELATIFPTKTPEFLGAGLPILVHCPKEYYLAEFVMTHNCGVVVSEKTQEAIVEAILRVTADSEEMLMMRRNAVSAARIFSANTVIEKFNRTISECLALKKA